MDYRAEQFYWGSGGTKIAGTLWVTDREELINDYKIPSHVRQKHSLKDIPIHGGIYIIACTVYIGLNVLHIVVCRTRSKRTHMMSLTFCPKMYCLKHV